MPSTTTKDTSHTIKTVLPMRSSHLAAFPMESGRSRSWYSFHMAPVHRHSVTKNSRPNRHVVVANGAQIRLAIRLTMQST